MLTADLVLARRRGAELRLVRLSEETRAHALDIAEDVIAAVDAHVGKTRGELEAAIDMIDVDAREERIKEGLAKLALDRCAWDEERGERAPELRRALFLRASAARRTLDASERFDRAAIMAEVAAAQALSVEALEGALYADLRDAQTLTAFERLSPPSLVSAWEHGQAQAVLLRATKVNVDVQCASAGATRALFHRMKFLRLLHTITKTDEGHRITIDGPFSLFESVTKYGLQLALVIPALESCDAWRLEADVRWGKERTPLLFRLEGGTRGASEGASPALPDSVQELVRAFERLESKWKVAPSGEIFDLPGIGLCVPDLVFTRARKRVFLEVMGFWSRDAVWRRVELVERGLAAPILFAVSSRLRVSEEVLGDEAPSALYVYKGAMSARAVLERIEALAAR